MKRLIQLSTICVAVLLSLSSLGCGEGIPPGEVILATDPPLFRPIIIPRFPLSGATYVSEGGALAETQAHSTENYLAALAIMIGPSNFIFQKDYPIPDPTPDGVQVYYGGLGVGKGYPIGVEFIVDRFGQWGATWQAANEHGPSNIEYEEAWITDIEAVSPNKTRRTPQCELDPDDPCDPSGGGGGGGGGDGGSKPKREKVWHHTPKPSDGPFFALSGYSRIPSRRTLRSIGRHLDNDFLDHASEFLSEVYDRNIDLRSAGKNSSGEPSHALALAEDLREDARQADKDLPSNDTDITWSELLSDIKTHYQSRNGLSAKLGTNSSEKLFITNFSSLNANTEERFSTEKVENGLSVMVYPNPSVGSVNIDLKGSTASIVQIKIFDILGRMVHQHTVDMSNGQVYTWDVSNGGKAQLPPGKYILRVQSGERTVESVLTRL